MENRYWSVGGVVSPLSSSVGGSTILKDADPVLYTLVDYLPAVIRTHGEARWNDEVAACGLSNLSSSMVAQALPYDPLPFAADNAWRFPLFTVSPTSTEFVGRTTTWYEVKRTFEVLYILPPLSSEQAERLYPFLSHVERTLQDRIYEGTDQDYNGGQNVWLSSGIEKISTVRATRGKIPGLASDIYFPCLSMELEIVERRNPASYLGNFSAYGGLVSGSIDIASGSSDIGQISGSLNGPITDFIVTRQTF